MIILVYLLVFIFLLSLAYEAIYYFKDNKLKEAWICIGIIVVVVGGFSFYELYEPNEVHLHTEIESPVEKALVPIEASIPDFLVKTSEFHSRNESAWGYKKEIDKEVIGLVPSLVISFKNFNDERKNCESLYDELNRKYTTKEIKVIQAESKKSAVFYTNSIKKDPTRDVVVEDVRGCLIVSVVGLDEELSEEDLIKVIQSVKRKE